MEAITPKVLALFEELGRQYEVLIYERSRRGSVTQHRVRHGFITAGQDRLDELLDARIAVVEDALKAVTSINEAIKHYNTLE